MNIGIGRYGKIHIVCTLLKLFSNLLQIIFNKVFIQPISIFLNTYQHFKLNEYLFLKVSAIISNKVLVVTQTQTTRFQPKVCSFANRHLLREVRRSVSLKKYPPTNQPTVSVQFYGAMSDPQFDLGSAY